MSQVMDLPAASHALAQMAVSPLILTFDLVADMLRSNGFAVTSKYSFSLNRLAVSFTTANACGSILSK